MKKYALLLLFTLSWAVISPFMAFKIIRGTFVPTQESPRDKDAFLANGIFSEEINSSNNTNGTQNENGIDKENNKTEDEDKASPQEDEKMKIELLTARQLLDTDYEKYSLECQKALAVAIRTQIINSESNYDADFDEKDIPQCVAETKGIIVTYDKAPINAIFHTSSYKTTVTSSSGEKYLLSVTTAENEEATKTIHVLTKDEFKDEIKSLCPDAIFEEEEIIKRISYTKENRCDFINVGNCAFSAEAFANHLSLPSTAIEIEETEDKITVTAYGEGNGIGLSIEGAEAMSKKGSTYDEILLHYYSGVELEKHGE